MPQFGHASWKSFSPKTENRLPSRIAEPKRNVLTCGLPCWRRGRPVGNMRPAPLGIDLDGTRSDQRKSTFTLCLNVTIGHDLLRISAALALHPTGPRSVPR